MPQLLTPHVAFHEEQSYAAIRVTIDMPEIPTVVPPLIGEVANWLQQHKVAEQGPCFFRYLSCTDNGRITVEAGIPVAKSLEGDDRVKGGSFPAGSYVEVTHMGDYSNLREAHMFLESWAERNGLTLQQDVHPDGVEWGSRTEIYVNDCEQEPDHEKWQTDISFLLAEQA